MWWLRPAEFHGMRSASIIVVARPLSAPRMSLVGTYRLVTPPAVEPFVGDRGAFGAVSLPHAQLAAAVRAALDLSVLFCLRYGRLSCPRSRDLDAFRWPSAERPLPG